MAVVVTVAKGYDLGYIWKTQGQASAARTPGGYYINAAQAGEPPGRWWGPGAQALGFTSGQVVERRPYDAVYRQRDPRTGAKLGRARGRYATFADHLAQLKAAEPHATAERVIEKRTQLRMKDGVDVMSSSLPPRSFEEPDTEGPVSLVDPAGHVVELSHELGGAVGALLRDVGRVRDVLLHAPQRPSAAVPRRSQEVLRRSIPWGARRHGIVNLPAATCDIDQPHVRVEDLEPFGLSRAGDADVQDGEVEMRDTVSP